MLIKSDPEFKSLVPPISPEEYTELEKSLQEEGCRDAIILWDDIILDGHNRFEICTKHDIPFKTISKGMDNRDQAKLWIISNQLSRRNLSPEQISYLRGVRQTIEAGDRGGDQKSNLQNESLIKKPKRENIAKKIADESGVSESTICRDAKFAKAVDKLPPEEKKEVLSGKSKKSMKEIVEGGDKQVGRKGYRAQKLLDNLFYLKSYWRKASKTEKKLFLAWIKEI